MNTQRLNGRPGDCRVYQIYGTRTQPASLPGAPSPSEAAPTLHAHSSTSPAAKDGARRSFIWLARAQSLLVFLLTFVGSVVAFVLFVRAGISTETFFALLVVFVVVVGAMGLLAIETWRAKSVEQL